MDASPFRLFIGWDSKEMAEWNVAQFTARAHASVELDIQRIAISHVRELGLYHRPTQLTEHGYWDEISQAPMSTGHAIARFLVPALCKYDGWALFTDGDVLFRKDIAALRAIADPRYAVQVVKHDYIPHETAKMQGQAQTAYPRKNWSSVILFNAGHPANTALTVDLVNTVPGRDLHRFCWLDDALIGELPAGFNYLVSVSAPNPDPAIVHYTLGTPLMPGYEHCEFSDEWYGYAKGCGYRFTRPPEPEALSA